MGDAPRPQAVVLLSGGLDSATCLAMARREGFACLALTVDYGQRHRVELEHARAVARAQGVSDHRVVTMDLRAIGGSALTAELEVPKHDELAQLEPGIPVTYVPARNTIFLSLAMGLAEAVGAADIFIGVNAVDYSGYPDCRPEFIAAFESLARLATRAGVEGGRLRVHHPLSGMSKAQIIRAAVELGVELGATHSCYDPSATGAACGRCDACLLRKKGFADAGVADPTRYA